MNQVGNNLLAEFPCCRTPVEAGRGSLRTADPLRASLSFAERRAGRSAGCSRHRRVTGAPGRDSAGPAPPAFIAYSSLKPWECKKAANPSGAGMRHWGDRPGSPRPAAGGGSRGQRPGCSCGCSVQPVASSCSSLRGSAGRWLSGGPAKAAACHHPQGLVTAGGVPPHSASLLGELVC